MILFNVSSKRIYREYQAHIQSHDNRNVDWYIDSKKVLHVFIIPKDSSFGYHYQVLASDVPELVSSIISKKGETLGIFEDEPGPVSISEDSLSSIRNNIFRDPLA